MYLLRGLPVARWGALETARALWGIGTHLGRAIPQNARGDLVGHVRDEGKELSDPHARGYQTRAAQSLHVDRCDVVGLLCVNKAKSGGISRVVSSMRVYNDLLEHCPVASGHAVHPVRDRSARRRTRRRTAGVLPARCTATTAAR